jgi:glycosyltransferase involved in cell wall biosynthesis
VRRARRRQGIGVGPRNPAVTAVSAFFPCYNDADAIGKMVHDVYTTLETLVDDFEVIVVDDGSADDSVMVLHTLQTQYPRLRVILHPENRGYGAALLSGFANATKQWVFYTDGDAQYDATEVATVIAAANETTDIVQGRKIGRGDPLHRKVIGRIYHHVVRFMFNLHVHDTDCDFRLIRHSLLDRVQLSSPTGCICVEMMFKFERVGAAFVEVPVHHYARPHGRSQFFRIPHIARAALNLAQLWTRLVVRRRPV